MSVGPGSSAARPAADDRLGAALLAGREPTPPANDRAAERLAAVADAARALGEAAIDDQQLSDAIAAQVATATGDACVVELFVNGLDGQSRAVAVHSDDECLTAELRPLASRRTARGPFGLWERVRDRRSASLVADGGAPGRWTPAEIAFARRWSVVAIVPAPLIARERLLGGIALIQRTAVPRDAADDELLRGLAACASLVLANARLARAAQEDVVKRREVEEALGRVDHQIQVLQGELRDLHQQILDRDERLHALLQRVVAGERRASSGAVELVQGLTSREREVLRLVADGLSNKEIGRSLGLTAGTAKNHVSHLLTKLEVADRVGAAVLAVEAGVARGPEHIGTRVPRPNAGRRLARPD